jgi:hypothetical protein
LRYVPILRGKQGEFTALSEISEEVRAVIRPVLEVVPDDTLQDVVQTFSKHAGNLLPNKLSVTVDCRQLWSAGRVGTGFDGHALQWISTYLGAFRQPVIPAFRATDPDGALDEVRHVQLAHERGGCLRQSLDNLPDSPGELSRLVDQALERTALRPELVDLILDAGYLADGRAVAASADLAIQLLSWATTRPWRSTALAGGAFPPTLRGLPPHQVIPFPRRETDLWRRVAAERAGPAPDFADYGVTHPRLPRAGFGRARANLRFTRGPDWHVVRVQEGTDSIGLCRDLAHVADWPPDPDSLPWGDRQLLARARGLQTRPGGPKNWRAWDTSHHLATVAASIGPRRTPA